MGLARLKGDRSKRRPVTHFTLDCLELPEPLRSDVKRKTKDECEAKLLEIAGRLAQAEGYDPAGMQGRMGQILDLSKTEICRWVKRQKKL